MNGDWIGPVLWLPSIFLIFYVVVSYIRTPRDGRPKRAIDPAIDPAIRGEIEQTMEWWDREFRKLSGEPEPRKPHLNGAERVWTEWALKQAINAGDTYRVTEFSAPTTAELNFCQEHEYVEDRSFANQYVRISCINCDWEMEDW